MSRKNKNYRKVLTLDLHEQRFASNDIQNELEKTLDSFISPYLTCSYPLTLKIIVGKGINSKTFIQGKSPLRFYTEKYLQKLNLTWTNGSFWEGEGAIQVFL